MSNSSHNKKEAAINADLINKSMPSIGILNQKKRIAAYKFATEYAMKLADNNQVSAMGALAALLLMSKDFIKSLDNVSHDIYKLKILSNAQFNYIGKRLALNYAIKQQWVTNPDLEWKELGPMEGEDFQKIESKPNDLDAVKFHLKRMGYDLLPYGVGVAEAELVSGYNAVDTASHIAHTTMAYDIKQAGDNIIKLMAFLPHGEGLLKLLKEYKDKGMMSEAQWKNDTQAVYRIMTVDEHQKKWIENILSDPISGKDRLATSRINYE